MMKPFIRETNSEKKMQFMKIKSTSPAALSLHAAFICLCIIAVASQMTRAADSNPPERMTFQGFLTDGNGAPLAATAPKNFDVVFRIYDSQSGGNQLWSEQQTVTVDNGYFSVLLGEGSAVGTEPRPALSSLFTGDTASDRFVETTVKGIGSGGSDATILPRLRLITSPYAYLAVNAINAGRLVNSTNAQIVTITGTNVGINVSSPAATLDIKGSVKVSAGLTVSGLTNTGVTRLDAGLTVKGLTNTSVSRLEGDVTVVDKITANRSYASTVNFSQDGSAYLVVKDLAGGNNPVLNWDAYDYTVYKRTQNEYEFAIGSTPKLRINSDKVIVDAPGGIEGRGTIPLGGIIMWSGSTVPSGWALCNGQTVNGYTTPDLRNRFIVGSGGTYSIGNTGGADTVTLTTSQIPAHSHYTTLAHNGYPDGYGDRTDNYYIMDPSRGSTKNYSTSSTGSGQPHENRPPYYALAFIMRVY